MCLDAHLMDPNNKSIQIGFYLVENFNNYFTGHVFL